MGKGASKEELLGMSRVRGLLCVMFVSDIVTADGKYLEEFSTARQSSREHDFCSVRFSNHQRNKIE